MSVNTESVAMQCGYKQGYSDGYSDGEIAILEKIKEEIEEMRSKQNCSCSDCLDILDNHIEELKGESLE